MASFKDNDGHKWSFDFDGLLLEEVASETGIDLADCHTAKGWLEIDTNIRPLVRVLSILLADEIREAKMSARDFSKRIKKGAIDSARRAMVKAGENFFPQDEWSKLRTNLKALKEGRESLSKMLPALNMLGDLPEDMRAGAAEAIFETVRQAGANIDFAALANQNSAGGQENTPSKNGMNSAENAKLTAVG